MSLHTASKYLASKGRNGDTELVHMTKGEIKGLQQLALAHGGSLTINPETGLVEAGWLKTLLPMVAGAALTVATGGTALAAYAPLMSAALAGGGMYAATGSLKDGLMAGLGAFGGANLAGGLMEAGAAGAAEATASTVPEVAAGAAPEVATAAAPQGMGTLANLSPEQLAQVTAQANANTAAGVGPWVTPEPAAFGSGAGFTGTAANIPGGAAFGSGTGAAAGVPEGYGTLANLTPQQYADVVARANANTAAGVGPFTGPKEMSWDLAGKNLEAAGKGLPDIGKVIMNAPGKTALPLAIAGFAGSQDSGVQGFPPDQDSGGSTLAGLSPDFQGYAPPQPNPYYKEQYTDYRKKQQGGTGALPALAEGGVARMAVGGMDPMNPMQNPIYPQGLQEHTNFASSTQYPNSIKSAMASDYDARTNPMTGQELPMGLAAGGIIAMASGTPKTLSRSPGMPDGGVYRDTDPDTATKDAYNAALIRLQKINKAAGTKGLTMPKTAMSQLGGSFDSVEERAAGGAIRYEGGGEATATDAGGMAVDFSGAPITLDSVTANAMQAAQNARGVGANAMGGAQPSYAVPQSAAGLAALSASAPQMMASLAANNPQTMAAMSAMNPYQRAPRPAAGPYVNPYAGNQIATPTPTTSYDFVRPLSTTKSNAIEEAARREAERIAAEQAAQNSGDGGSWGYAGGGIAHYNLGGYSDGGRMLKGPGDGMSDDIPASIGGKQPARLADGEFVIPADVVSHLGNGSTDAGAKKLYGMMDKVRKARTGTKKQGKQIKADKYLPK